MRDLKADLEKWENYTIKYLTELWEYKNAYEFAEEVIPHAIERALIAEGNINEYNNLLYQRMKVIQKLEAENTKLRGALLLSCQFSVDPEGLAALWLKRAEGEA